MLVNIGIIFLLFIIIAFIYIIKVIARDFDAPIKATKKYFQPKVKQAISSETVKNLAKPYSPSIARYVLSLILLFIMAKIVSVTGNTIITEYIGNSVVILAGLSAVPLVFIAAMPYHNKIEMGKLRFAICFVTVLLMWLMVFCAQKGVSYIPNSDLSFFVLYWVSIILSYYCCVHTYKSWFFLIIFWLGPFVFLPFAHKEEISWMLVIHAAILPASFIGMRLLVEFYSWVSDRQNKSSKNT